MRLVLPPRGANAGLKRYKGEGVYRSIGRKNTSLRKVTKEEADAIALRKKSAGKGIDDSTKTMDNDDFVDSPSSDESVKDSAMEAINNSSIETGLDEDKESILDGSNESTKDDEDSAMKALSNSSNDTASDEITESILDGKEGIQNEKEFDKNVGKEASAVKRKYPPSLVDFIINKNTEDSSTPSKLQCFDSSMSNCHDENNTSTKSTVDEFDTHLNSLLNDKKDHSLIKIPPTKKKRYPQKICVNCRKNFGVRNDTRYICTQCNVALCKEPCFSEYHCNK